MKTAANVGHWTADAIRSWDYFASPVSLTFKGKKKFATLLGGVFTLIMVWIVLSYGGILLSILINKSDTMRSLSVSNRDISVNPDTYSVDVNSFGVSLLFTDKDEKPFFDSTYFDINFNQGLRTNNSSGTTTKLSSHGKVKWDLNISSTYQSEVLKDYTYCSADSNFDVSGNSMSNQMKYIQIDFKKWKGDPSCQTDTTINSKLKNGQVYLHFKMKYMDFNDYETPVKPVIDDKHLFRIIPGFQKVVYVYLQKNEVELKDGLIQISQVDNYEFYSVGQVDQDLDTEEADGVMLSIRIVQDDDVNIYERKVFSILELFGQMGGVYEVIRLLFELFVAFFAKKLMMYTLFSHIYYTESNLGSSNLVSKNNNSTITPKEKITEANKNISSSIAPVDQNDITPHYFYQNSINCDFNVNQNNSEFLEKSDQFWESVKDKLKHRFHFSYSIKDYFKTCIAFLNSKSKADYNKMKKRYADEVDIISIVYLLRKLKILMKVVLTNQQQFLLNFDPTSNIVSNSHPEDSEDWLSDYSLFLKAENSQKLITQIENCVEASKLKFLRKASLCQMEGKTPKDLRLINSLIGENAEHSFRMNEDSKLIAATNNSNLELLEEVKLDENKQYRSNINIRRLV